MPRINNLPNATALSLSDKVLGVVDGLAKNMTLSLLKSLIGTTVEDSLTSDSATNALSAAQGKALMDSKLDSSAYNNYYKGTYTTLGNLQSAHATSTVGSYALVDGGSGQSAVIYVWDAQDGWVQGGASGSLANTDALAEGSTNLYFTESRVRDTDLTGLSLTTNAVISAADSVLSALGKLQKQISDVLSNQRYTFVSDSNTTYTVPASAVTENSRTIIELSNNSLTSITINAATGTGKVAGDSVNISITGTYAAQVLVADGVTLQGDLTFSYQYETKTLIYKGSNVWKVVG
jgi:hypothetical protein